MTATRLLGRLVDAAGAPLAGRVTITGRGASSPMSVLLDAAGRFSADADPAAVYDVTDPAGSSWAVDVTSSPPTVMSGWVPGAPRLELSFVGDPAMQGQTTASVAAQARVDAAAARATADAAQAASTTLSSTLALAMATMQAALTAAQAAQSRKIGLVVGRTAVPNLAVNVDTARPIVWSAPSTPSTAVVLLEPTGTLLGQISATITAGSLKTSGCQVVLRAPIALGLAAGSVVVVGAYLT